MDSSWTACPPCGMCHTPDMPQDRGCTFAAPPTYKVGDAVMVDGKPAVVMAAWLEEDCGGFPVPVVYAKFCKGDAS